MKNIYHSYWRSQWYSEDNSFLVLQFADFVLEITFVGQVVGQFDCSGSLELILYIGLSMVVMDGGRSHLWLSSEHHWSDKVQSTTGKVTKIVLIIISLF